jgi:hypothetical protein
MGRNFSFFLPYHAQIKNKICIENEKIKKRKKSRVKKFDLKQGDVFQNAKFLFFWKILFLIHRYIRVAEEETEIRQNVVF